MSSNPPPTTQPPAGVPPGAQAALAAPSLEQRVSELEAALASHIAQTTAGGPNGGHWWRWFEKFKHRCQEQEPVKPLEVAKSVLPEGGKSG